MDQLANFLGHDIRIHRKFYRLPDKTLQLAKISKILLALENGRLAEFHGKNLDEITIDPNENVMGSDEEDECREDGDHSFAVDEPSAEEIVADVGNEKSTGKNHKEPSAEHGAVSHVAHSSKEPSAEENVADVGNENSTGKKHKEPSADGAVSPMAHSSKGRAAQKRRPWQAAEIRAVERQMIQFIRSSTVPTKTDCEKCLRAEAESLRNRNWLNLKFYVYNRITALKKKMHHK
ncbi:uncharacterized protein [Paralichthys olivaceus]|uniref:uncharacterized protein n=1 Tax=Paralichthys olivaceus TaxID=8255 RepID=UPI003750EED8